jgi:UPF0148 protein
MVGGRMSSANTTDPSRDPKVVKKMAQLMMQGAVMLAERCPICGLPLFRLRNGDIVCPVHGKVVIVSDEREADELRLDHTIHLVEKYAASKVENLIGSNEPEEILDWLRVIEAVERIKHLRRETSRRSERKGEKK